MKRPIILLILLALCLYGKGQQPAKPAVTESIFDHWNQLQGQGISNDGKYVWYRYGPVGNKNWLCIRAVGKGFNKKIANGDQAQFSKDSKYCFYQTSQDSLFLLNLKTGISQYINKVNSFQLAERMERTYLLYSHGTEGRSLTVKDLKTGLSKTLDSVSQYHLFPENQGLVYANNRQLLQFDFEDFDTKILTSTENISNIAINAQANKVGFLTGGEHHKQLHFVALNDQRPIEETAVLNLPADYYLSDFPLRFTPDGSKLFFRIQKDDVKKEKTYNGAPDVWAFNDKFIQPEQLQQDEGRSLLAVYDISKQKLLQLDNAQQSAYLLGKASNQWMLMTENYGLGEAHWNPSQRLRLYLSNLNTGKQDTIASKYAGMANFQLSPDERYVVYYDRNDNHYYSYEIASHRTYSQISKGLPFPLFQDELNYPLIFGSPGWLNGKLLLYDEYDLWLVDPTGQQSPKNITKGYGRKNNTVLRLMGNQPIYKNGDKVILLALNKENKDNGFFQITLNSNAEPIELSMGPYFYHMKDMFLGFMNSESAAPLKAKNANVYLVGRQSAEQSLNLYVTKDFKRFEKFTDIQPERNVNWLTTELIKFPMGNDETGEGVLFKPESFDPSKKYPIIFHYYDEYRSNELHMYKAPHYTGANIDIPTYVSNGYLVFLSNLKIEAQNTAESITRTVVSAANYLKQYPFVDSSKMGLQGHSYGGYATNSIITHSKLFAAACEANGPVDFVSYYNGLFDNERTSHSTFEDGWGGLKATLWERPDLYIKNSPIFQLNEVTTPLLIIHNKEDFRVPFSQGIELYMGMRRLQKPCWLLQYDGQGHTTLNGSEDMTRRMQQFFDHYLKGKPAPVWMTKGIPAKLQGINSGLELDTSSTANNN
ncbi:prolyl oligopeptidase family serine peptidase [Mucilaginibacter sp. CAU 1740]|uniref:S9 family peptidase n=1 Tax=Mucilaginibacter sp. CAU 1740 TaxID=3140365 RepID=UPI00325B84FB